MSGGRVDLSDERIDFLHQNRVLRLDVLGLGWWVWVAVEAGRVTTLANSGAFENLFGLQILAHLKILFGG